MARKGWALLAVCVAALAVGAILFARYWPAGTAVGKAQPQSDGSSSARPSETGATQAPQQGTAVAGHGVRVMTYMVKRGDTLEAISLRFLGSAAKWRAVAKENGIRGSRIRTGMRLHITVPSAS